MVERLHGKIPGHELNDGLQAHHRCANAQPTKSIFGDRRINHAARAEFLQESLRHFIRALIFGNFFAHDEHALVLAHLFAHSFTKRFSELYFSHYYFK